MVWGRTHRNTGYESLLVAVSRSVRNVSASLRWWTLQKGHVPAEKEPWCRAVGSGLERRMWAVCRVERAPWTEAAGRRYWARENKCFSIKVYSWWHCTTEWAPQSGREGRRCGPGWPDCTWARREHCTAPAQTCRENTWLRHRAPLWGGYRKPSAEPAGGRPPPFRKWPRTLPRPSCFCSCRPSS